MSSRIDPIPLILGTTADNRTCIDWGRPSEDGFNSDQIGSDRTAEVLTGHSQCAVVTCARRDRTADILQHFR